MNKIIALLVLNGPAGTPDITHLHFDAKHTYIRVDGCSKRVEFKVLNKDASDNSVLDYVVDSVRRYCYSN